MQGQRNARPALPTVRLVQNGTDADTAALTRRPPARGAVSAGDLDRAPKVAKASVSGKTIPAGAAGAAASATAPPTYNGAAPAGGSGVAGSPAASSPVPSATKVSPLPKIKIKSMRPPLLCRRAAVAHVVPMPSPVPQLARL